MYWQAMALFSSDIILPSHDRQPHYSPVSLRFCSSLGIRLFEDWLRNGGHQEGMILSPKPSGTALANSANTSSLNGGAPMDAL